MILEPTEIPPDDQPPRRWPCCCVKRKKGVMTHIKRHPPTTKKCRVCKATRPFNEGQK